MLLITGIIGIIWFIFWLLLGFDSPATHPRISQSERKYIETSISEAKVEEIHVRKVNDTCVLFIYSTCMIYCMVVIKLLNYAIQVPTPWLQIFLSPPVWGIIIAHFCGNFGYYVLLTTMPTYFSQALGFDLGTVRSVVYMSVCVYNFISM